MTNKELIEKVARAIADINHGHDRHWEGYYSDAQAAISTILAALQEPSEGMHSEGRTTLNYLDSWRAMLAASALGEQAE